MTLDVKQTRTTISNFTDAHKDIADRIGEECLRVNNFGIVVQRLLESAATEDELARLGYNRDHQKAVRYSLRLKS